MTTPAKLLQLAARTGLDSIAEALTEAASTIETLAATISRRDAVIKLLEGEVAQAHESRRAAQAENADLKERQARSGIAQRRAVTQAVKDEREACAQACDKVYHEHIGPEYGEVRYGIATCATAIRARKD